MATDRNDLYAALGLTPQATQEQIRRAYRALMRQNHPDTRTPADPASIAASDTRLRQAVAAYKTLGDPVSRAAYDQLTRPRARPAPTHVASSGGHLRVEDEPPIKAGPVRWHRGPTEGHRG